MNLAGLSEPLRLAYAKTDEAYSLWTQRIEEIILFIKKIAYEADLVTTVAEMNLLKIESCNCSESCQHKPHPKYVAQVNADLEASLSAFAARYDEAEMQLDYLVTVHLNVLVSEDPLLRDVTVELARDARNAEEAVRCETGRETRDRLAQIANTVQDVAMYALETEKRGFAFDCSDQLRGIAEELERELSDWWFKFNAKESIYTVPILTAEYLRKAREQNPELC